MPQLLYPRGKSAQYPLDRLGGPQSRSGWRREEKIFDPTGTRNSDLSAIQPVARHYTNYAIPAPWTRNISYIYSWLKIIQSLHSHVSLYVHFICILCYEPVNEFILLIILFLFEKFLYHVF
jgi:hypothetical protein